MYLCIYRYHFYLLIGIYLDCRCCYSIFSIEMVRVCLCVGWDGDADE